LLVAADELAQTGECDPQEIFSEAHQLEEHMNGFLLRVERQRHLLDLSVAFFTHIKEVRVYFDRNPWFNCGLYPHNAVLTRYMRWSGICSSIAVDDNNLEMGIV